MIGHRSATYSDKTVATNAGIVPAPATNNLNNLETLCITESYYYMIAMTIR